MNTLTHHTHHTRSGMGKALQALQRSSAALLLGACLAACGGGGGAGGTPASSGGAQPDVPSTGLRLLAGDDGSSNATPADIDGTGAAARFNYTFVGMGADSAGNLYVGDKDFVSLHVATLGMALRKVTPAGVVTTIPHTARLRNVSGLVVDRSGNTYVAEAAAYPDAAAGKSGTIYKIGPDGASSVLAGSALAAPGQVDGNRDVARFTNPSLVGMDSDGNLYVNDADASGYHVRKVSPAGAVITIPALPAGLGQVTDAAGNVYQADYQNHVVTRSNAAGVSSVIAGTPGKNGSQLGALPGALSYPFNLVRLGDYRFALFSGRAIVLLDAPH